MDKGKIINTKQQQGPTKCLKFTGLHLLGSKILQRLESIAVGVLKKHLKVFTKTYHVFYKVTPQSFIKQQTKNLGLN